ncbi:hypothetical protein DMN91_008879 [Ooceraea biroi]|uniref:Uncharacterized protein n=1 Tax=Ooceraea biroi TaxID=2015173 RepID=A0A026W066_OOCBI|nr:uncharacterized protein LOC105284700 [Ooceraea biroi]EZA49412.1 hypothetical protein X777_11910 [Ooceraea biroi]RLU18522.1 hypothetical protein DMN91_008879 [Ooceraea biroi]
MSTHISRADQLQRLDVLNKRLLQNELERYGNKLFIVTRPVPVPDANQRVIKEDSSELHKLVEVLQDGYKCSLYNFEPNYLNKFSSQTSLGEDFSVKHVLEKVMKLHYTCHEEIGNNSMSREIVTYRYIYNNQYRFIKFHNDMELHDDMLILLYLHSAITPHAFKSKPVQQLLFMLHRKYQIQNACCNYHHVGPFDDQEEDEEDREKETLTVYRLLYTFPSITISLFQENLNPLAEVSQILFIEFEDLPSAIFHHMISTVIPCSVKPAPTALFSYILQKFLCFTCDDEDISFQTFFATMRQLYRNNIFPEEMKIQLCLAWNILEQRDGKLVFSRAIMDANERAKYLLQTTMEDEHINHIVNL